MSRLVPTPDEARELLQHVSADCDRGQWLRVGMALREGLDDAGWALFNEWSASAPHRYNAAECQRAWDSLSPAGGVTWGTLRKLATDSGWRPLTAAASGAAVTEWEIRDMAGAVVAVHVRRDKPFGAKDVWWLRPDGTKGLGGRKTRTLPLYGSELLANVVGADMVVIVEGEKSADALRDAESDLLVLGTVTGAAGTPSAGVLRPVAELGLPIYLWADHDDDGAAHMQRIGKVLVEAGCDPDKVLVLPAAIPARLRDDQLGRYKGWDAADWAKCTDTDNPSWSDLAERSVPWEPKQPAAAHATQAAGAKRETRPVADAFDTSPAEVARRIIERYGADLLVVDDGDYGTGYALDPATGIWRAGGKAWARWLVEIADDMRVDAINSGLVGNSLTAAVNAALRLKRPGMVDQIRLMLCAMLGYLRDRGKPCTAVTECRADEIDANMRFLGAGNGVVDLHTGALLAPADGRAALVSLQTPVEFDPTATHPAVDRLFAHLDQAAVGWWWRVLGFHLLGAPSRRFYVAVGPPSGGKTTLANAIAGVLGPYASRPADDALEARPGRSAGLSPELEAFTAPRRWAIIDEAPRMKIAAPLLKRLSGDTSQTFRRLHEQLRTVPATATVLVICNPRSVPKLRLQDEAMADRLRELPYPVVPSPDPSIKETIETPEFRRAFLARLVKAGAAETPREPPADVPVVRAATDDRVREDVGELGAFARRIVRGAARLTVADVWTAWCQHNEESADAIEAGGFGKRRLSTALREHVEGLSAPKQTSINGKVARGWRGWQLLDAAPPVADEPAAGDRQVYVDLLRDWCQRQADPHRPPAPPVPGTAPIPDSMATAELRCRLDHAPATGATVTLCNAELWPLARLRVAEVLEPPQPGAEWAALAVDPFSAADLLRDGGAPQPGAGTWWRVKMHRVHIGRALQHAGKARIVDQDVVMLYRRGADDADDATGDLFAGNGKAP